MKTKILLLLVCIASLFSCNNPTENEQTSSNDTTTYLQIINASDTSVIVWVTLGATDGCLQNVSQIPFVTDSLGSLVGSFTLNAHDSTICYAPIGLGFNGNISFDTQPLNCPDSVVPNGVNMFEFILNNSFQAGNPQETIDISCVAGVNCYLKTYLIGGSIWNAGATVPNVDSIYNKDVNSGLVGVYPYGCDTCTGAKTPPTCVTTSIDKQVAPICNVQRNAIGSNGGIVQLIYLKGKTYINSK